MARRLDWSKARVDNMRSAGVHFSNADEFGEAPCRPLTKAEEAALNRKLAADADAAASAQELRKEQDRALAQALRERAATKKNALSHATRLAMWKKRRDAWGQER